MAVLPDGRTIWPYMSDRLLRVENLPNLPPIRQVQIVQTEPDAVDARLVADRAAAGVAVHRP